MWAYHRDCGHACSTRSVEISLILARVTLLIGFREVVYRLLYVKSQRIKSYVHVITHVARPSSQGFGLKLFKNGLILFCSSITDRCIHENYARYLNLE